MSFGALKKYTDCFWRGFAVRPLTVRVISVLLLRGLVADFSHLRTPACPDLYVVQATAAKFALQAGNVQLQHTNWRKNEYQPTDSYMYSFICVSCLHSVQ